MSKIVALLLALAGMPLFAVTILVAILSHRQAEIDLQAIIISFNRLTETPFLSSLPLFGFSGYLLARSRAPHRLLRISNAVLGWLPGGLAIVAIWLCSLVTALTGASGVTIVALGGLLLPALLDNRYPERFSLGITTVGGSLGLLFPPSLPVILYCVVSGTAIEDLFLAAALPGLLILLLLSGYAMFRGQREGVPRKPFSASELLQALREGLWEVLLPIGIVAGIYGGWLTVTEAAVTATTYVLIIEVVVYRDIRLSQLGAIARETMVLVGGILIILGMTMAVTNYVIDAEVPQLLFEEIHPYMASKYTFLVCLNLFLLFVGCMIDIYAAIALIVPLIVPIAAQYGVHPVHLGIIFLTNMGIGYVTPPVGLNLFIASVRFKRPVLTLYWSTLPFTLLLLVALAIVTYFPALSLFLLEP
jgi:C4-dicarboxylate transporter DctM subunit